MFYMVAYFLAAYLVVAIAIGVLGFASKVPPRLRLTLIAAFLLAPLMPYAVVAAQTAIFSKAMRPAAQQALYDSGWSDGQILTMRIMSINPLRTTVYVTEHCTSWPDPDPGNRRAFLFVLKNTPAGWIYEDGDVVWSNCGSAEGNTFPPYPEAREF